MTIKIVKKATAKGKPQGWCPWYVDDFPAPKK